MNNVVTSAMQQMRFEKAKDALKAHRPKDEERRIVPDGKGNRRYSRFFELAPVVMLLTLVAVAYVAIAYLVAASDGTKPNRTSRTAPNQTIR